MRGRLVGRQLISNLHRKLAGGDLRAMQVAVEQHHDLALLDQPFLLRLVPDLPRVCHPPLRLPMLVDFFDRLFGRDFRQDHRQTFRRRADLSHPHLRRIGVQVLEIGHDLFPPCQLIVRRHRMTDELFRRLRRRGRLAHQTEGQPYGQAEDRNQASEVSRHEHCALPKLRLWFILHPSSFAFVHVKLLILPASRKCGDHSPRGHTVLIPDLSGARDTCGGAPGNREFLVNSSLCGVIFWTF